MVKKIAIAFLCFFSIFCVCAEEVTEVTLPPVFNELLSADEREKLLQGETVIRNVGKVKKVCIDSQKFSETSPIRHSYNLIKELDPSYLAEIIQIRPVAGNENLPTKIHDAIIDVKSYIGIPYWSVRHEKYFDLYSDANIVSQELDGTVEHIQADLTMDPFGVINAKILSDLTPERLFYQMTNQNNLYHQDRFKCVSAECMISTVVVERCGDYWILYGLGGVDAPSIFFLRDRIETSFINRIKTFCVFFFSKEKSTNQ